MVFSFFLFLFTAPLYSFSIPTCSPNKSMLLFNIDSLWRDILSTFNHLLPLGILLKTTGRKNNDEIKREFEKNLMVDQMNMNQLPNKRFVTSQKNVVLIT